MKIYCTEDEGEGSRNSQRNKQSIKSASTSVQSSSAGMTYLPLNKTVNVHFTHL